MPDGGSSGGIAIMKLLLMVRDLMFSSRIISAAKEAGVDYDVIRDPAKLESQSADLLILDLNQAGTIEAASRWKTATGGCTLGFVSHVDTGIIDEAKQAGIERVMSRGQFTQQLPNLFPR